jgi:DNA-binding Lrp family transcriptional regulator
MTRSPKLDRIDINILSELQRNGRLTNASLADAVCLSPSPCLQRVKKLEKAGYIETYNAKINIAKLTDHIIVYTQVTLEDHKREDFVKFEAEIRKYDVLQECHLVSGGFDYQLKFVVPSIDFYQEMMERILDRRIGMEKYFSFVVIKSVVNRQAVPIKALLPDS